MCTITLSLAKRGEAIPGPYSSLTCFAGVRPGAMPEPVLKLYRYGSFWLIKPKACTNQKVVRDTSCLTEIKASRSAFLVAKSAKSAKYRVFCGYTWKNPGIPG